MISQVNAWTLAWEKCQLKLATTYCRRNGKKLGLFENLRVYRSFWGKQKSLPTIDVKAWNDATDGVLDFNLLNTDRILESGWLSLNLAAFKLNFHLDKSYIWAKYYSIKDCMSGRRGFASASIWVSVR